MIIESQCCHFEQFIQKYFLYELCGIFVIIVVYLKFWGKLFLYCSQHPLKSTKTPHCGFSGFFNGIPNIWKYMWTI